TGLTGALTTYGLALPANFDGGIMSVTGNVTADIAGNDLTDTGWNTTSGEVVGTVTALTGNVTSDITATNGDFGGLIIPLGDYTGALIATQGVDMIIIPDYNPVTGTFTDGIATAASLTAADLSFTTALINGETIVSKGQAYQDATLTVTTADAGVLAYVNTAGNALTVVNGLAAGNSIDVMGNLVALTVDGTWAGTVDMMSNSAAALGQTSVATGYAVTTVTANGEIDASTAQLLAVDFTNFVQPPMYSLINDGAADNFVIGGVLDAGNNSVQFTNTAGDTQTVAMVGGKNVQMDYEMYFGKITDATLSGRGNVQVVSTNVDIEGATARETAKNAKAVVKDTARHGLPAAEGTANVGDVSVHGFDKVNLKGVVVDGTLGALASGTADVKNLYVNGDVQSLNIGDRINGAFINGNLGSLIADRADKLTVMGNATSVTLQSSANQVYLNGAAHGDFQAVKANKVFIDGSVTDFHVATTNQVVINGAVGDFGAMNVKNTTVDGNVANLDIQARGSIINSTFNSVTTGNVDTTKKIMYVFAANGTGATGAVGDLVLTSKPVTNPNFVKVTNSILDDGAWANSAAVIYVD
ncbi:MAG: hypothetical protein K9M57_02490, partial [Phycisphaerae bacterium]|nr:hypothetical protein [Phycisphaerae bacterium]